MSPELKSLHEEIGVELNAETINWDVLLRQSRTFYNLVVDSTIDHRHRVHESDINAIERAGKVHDYEHLHDHFRPDFIEG